MECRLECRADEKSDHVGHEPIRDEDDFSLPFLSIHPRRFDMDETNEIVFVILLGREIVETVFPFVKADCLKKSRLVEIGPVSDVGDGGCLERHFRAVRKAIAITLPARGMARVELIGDGLEAKHLDITGKKAIQRNEKTTHVLDWFRFERERAISFG